MLHTPSAKGIDQIRCKNEFILWSDLLTSIRVHSLHRKLSTSIDRGNRFIFCLRFGYFRWISSFTINIIIINKACRNHGHFSCQIYLSEVIALFALSTNVCARVRCPLGRPHGIHICVSTSNRNIVRLMSEWSLPFLYFGNHALHNKCGVQVAYGLLLWLWRVSHQNKFAT